MIDDTPVFIHRQSKTNKGSYANSDKDTPTRNIPNTMTSSQTCSSMRMFMLMFMILIGMVMWSDLEFFSYQNAYLAQQNQDQSFLALGDDLGNGMVHMVTNSSKIVNTSDGLGAFHQLLATFDWSKPWAEEEWQRFFLGLIEFNYQEPRVAINSACSPPALLTSDEIRCEDYPTAQFKEKRKQPAKIGHAIQFGFDVDTLEVHLNELYDVVDKFFIVEWTESHNAQFNPKPLSWERVKKQPRFRKFEHKVVHLILDDLDTAAAASRGSTMWTREVYQETLRWQKIVLWNNRTSYFGPDDVIGLGDTDEIASRRNVELVKHCAMGKASLDIGIWFPFGNVGYAFRSDFPVPGHQYTLGDPTFWTFASATEYHRVTRKIPSRMRGKSMSYLLGGIHMSHYSYLPPRIIKSLTATEAGARDGLWAELADAFNSNNLAGLEAKLALPNRKANKRIKPLSEIPAKSLEGIVYHPWFYECNRARYPRWEWKSDSRLGVL
jgi:hypothetical protein